MSFGQLCEFGEAVFISQFMTDFLDDPKAHDVDLEAESHVGRPFIGIAGFFLKFADVGNGGFDAKERPSAA